MFVAIKMDYQWINGPDCGPDWYCALASPSRPLKRPSSNRRKVGKRIRKSVVAIEPAPNRMALNVPEVAWLLNCSPNKVWGLVGSGELTSFTLGRKRLVARETVEAFISESEANS